MKYETQVLEAFTRLGFKPRDNQAEHIDRIIVAFLDENFTNVILSAPTGTGKSIIGAVVAEVLHTVKSPGDTAKASFMLTATNVLAQQYHDTFGDKEHTKDGDFLIIKGASNYACEAMSTVEEPAKADSCTIQLFRKSGMTDMIEKYCNVCEYSISRKQRNASRHLITNYAYFFVDRMYAAAPMEKRTVTIFDEAHLLNDLFVEHNSIHFSERKLRLFAEEVSDQLEMGYDPLFTDIKQLSKDLTGGKITDDTYERHLGELQRIYNEVSQLAKMRAERNFRNPSKYLKLSRISKKYHDLGCKIDDLFIFDYPHIFEYRPKDLKKGQNEHEVSVKPIFVSEMFEALHNADHNLLMSATVSEGYIKRTMTLPGTTKHIKLEPSFSPASKKVVFYKPQALNYTTMKDAGTVSRLCASVKEIVEHHTGLGERGIILAPSFSVVEEVVSALRLKKGLDLRIFGHIRGDKLADLLEDFKDYQDGPAVLVTPSGFEGLDLPGDLSRYQVIVKAPFASLGDKRIKHIADTFPDIFALTALMKIVQGAGRSVRSSTDYATTYILDTAAQRLWTKGNPWADEFVTSFSSTLGDEN
jgi:ATP-dependent DNA helicase DinG